MTYCDFHHIMHVMNTYYVLIKKAGTTTGILSHEITDVAPNHINDVAQFLKEQEITYPNKYQAGFKNRIFIHLIHHHIKYDKKWSIAPKRLYIRGLEDKGSDFGGITTSPSKYTLAYL